MFGVVGVHALYAYGGSGGLILSGMAALSSFWLMEGI